MFTHSVRFFIFRKLCVSVNGTDAVVFVCVDTNVGNVDRSFARRHYVGGRDVGKVINFEFGFEFFRLIFRRSRRQNRFASKVTTNTSGRVSGTPHE